MGPRHGDDESSVGGEEGSADPNGWIRRESGPIERAVGIDGYVSGAPGIRGRLRESPEDFHVTELEAFDPEPLDADVGSYPELVVRVTLRNWDTNDFARRISDALSISRERVSWAGTKDKRAITTQLFTLRGVDVEDLPSIRDVDIEPLGRAGRGLTFGDLAGNAFRIRVADAVPDAAERVADVTSDLATFAGTGEKGGENGKRSDEDGEKGDANGERSHENGAGTESTRVAGNHAPIGDPVVTTVGVPNYFGQQRFGSMRPVTHLVGLAIVRGDPREAVRLYAGNPSPAEPADTREARRRVDVAFGVGAGGGPPNGENQEGENGTADVSERGAVDATGDGDWGACLDVLPGKLRFERSMVHRLQEDEVDPGAPADADAWFHALEAVPTNLQRLFVNAAQSVLFNRIVSERLRRGLPFDRPVAGDVACFADSDAPDSLYAPDTDRLQRVTEARVSVMERHSARGRAFVTAPLVGTETELGGGEPGEIERTVLAEAEIAPEDFDLPGEFHSSGTRRAILLRTDLTTGGAGSDPESAFALPSGSYATVLLREFLKSGPLEL